MDIPEGYVLVPKGVYDLLLQVAMPPKIQIDPSKIDPSKIDLTPVIGAPSVTCHTQEAGTDG